MSTAPPFSPIAAAPVCVALSGGMDSMALLRALAADDTVRTHGLRALHVHHGLHPAADDWAAHCLRACDSLGIGCSVERVHVVGDGLGREGAARAARHAAFARHLRDEEYLALAHHRDDQAETFLLRALRASGVDGLGAMSPLRRFAMGWLWRPWLDVPRARIERYARACGLRWIDDPSNEDASLDRNFLRHHVLPLLREHWPHADAAFAASAMHARDATRLLSVDDETALSACTPDRADTLSIEALLALQPARRARVLRAWIGALGLPPLPAGGLRRIESDLLAPRDDATARFEWHGAVVRSWRGWLHAASVSAPLDLALDLEWDGHAPIGLPHGGRLTLEPSHVLSTPVRVRARRGGERIRLAGRPHSHALKHVLQDLRVPPWTREHLPLLMRGEDVLAAGDIVVSGGFGEELAAAGSRLAWTRPPGA